MRLIPAPAKSATLCVANVCPDARQIAEGGDLAVPHGQIAPVNAVLIGDRPAAENDIIGFGHKSLPL